MQEAISRLTCWRSRVRTADVDGPGVVIMSISLEEVQLTVERELDDWQAPR